MNMEQGARSGAPLDSSAVQRTSRKSGNRSPDQVRALQRVEAWLDDPYAPQEFLLDGPAGSGKTTIAKDVVAMAGSSVFGAYCGKAVDVLRRKGCTPANTIHGWMYAPRDSGIRDEIAAIDKAVLTATPEEQSALRIARIALVQRLGDLEWDLRPNSKFATARLIILDEVSMVDRTLAEDVLSYGTKVLAIGDKEQLPPIAGKGYFTSRTPDAQLTEVHRQESGGAILDLATRIRLGGLVGRDVGKLSTGDYARVGVGELLAADQVIVGRRQTRWNIIRQLRAATGSSPNIPQAGDTVMVLKNQKKLGLFNGQQLTVTANRGPHPLSLTSGDPREWHWQLTLNDGEGGSWELNAPGSGFLGDDAENYMLGDRKYREKGAQRLIYPGVYLSFDAALTCHKAQGSEWSNVIIVNESDAFDDRRWNTKGGGAPTPGDDRKWEYTAVTRASDTLTVTDAVRG